MTQEDIIRMAKEAELWELLETFSNEFGDGNPENCMEEVERFAALVAAHEREACHALRQTLPNPYKDCQVSSHAYDMAIVAYGAAIRARGQA